MSEKKVVRALLKEAYQDIQDVHISLQLEHDSEIDKKLNNARYNIRMALEQILKLDDREAIDLLFELQRL